jgi:phosphoglycolate phosphatase
MQLAIFDCDGTIADSQHMIVEAMNGAFATARLPQPAREDVVAVIGLSLEQAVRELLPETGAGGAAQIAEDYKQAFHALRAAGVQQEPLFPGMRDAILRLKADGFLLGIATGKSVRGVKVLLEREGLLGEFDTIQTADTHPSKPHPSMIEVAMLETGQQPHETVMIGDTVFDMAMARNAGVAAIGVGWGYHATDALIEAGADVIAGDAGDMLAAIARLTAPVRTARA